MASKSDGFEHLAVEVDELTGRMGAAEAGIDGLKTSVQAYGETLEAVLQNVATRTETAAQAGPANSYTTSWWWPYMSAEEAHSSWLILGSFVDQLHDRSPAMARALRSCWYRHTDVVDVLTALYVAWTGAYAPDALPTARVEWQIRWLKDVVETATQAFGSCRASCLLLEDRDPSEHATTLEEFIRWDVEQRPPANQHDAEPI